MVPNFDWLSRVLRALAVFTVSAVATAAAIGLYHLVKWLAYGG